jgi:uncharacterized protein YdaT
MPWTGKTFRERHNKGLTPMQGDKAAKQATAMVKAGVPEGMAIATANKHARDKPAKKPFRRHYKAD